MTSVEQSIIILLIIMVFVLANVVMSLWFKVRILAHKIELYSETSDFYANAMSDYVLKKEN